MKFEFWEVGDRIIATFDTKNNERRTIQGSVNKVLNGHSIIDISREGEHPIYKTVNHARLINHTNKTREA